MTATDSDVYYDPYDFDIDADPYPIWKRLRDEQPLYYNERYDFYALSRFDDVEKASVDWRTYSSARGTVLEIIKANMEVPPGSVIFADPPLHDRHRALLSRVFTPRPSGQAPRNYINRRATTGNETTIRLIGWIRKVLDERPDEGRKIAANRDLVPNAIEEVLRFESPSPVQARYVTTDAEWHGRVLPEGSAVLLLTASGNRDERKFPDADRFDITRKIDHHLS